MAITAVGTDGTTAATSQGTAVTSALPTGITDGDLVIIEVSHGSGGPPGTTITTPSGWNLLNNLDDGSTKLPTFWRFFVTGDSAPSFTLGTSRSWATHSTAFRGVAQSGTINQLNQTAQASSTNYTSGSITPGVDNCMIVVCWGGKIAAGGTQTITTASGWTATGAINQSSIAAVTNQWCHFQFKLQTTATLVNEAVTIGTAAVGQATIVALAPATGNATVTAVMATATADALAPTVTADATVSAVLAAAAADALTPAVSADATVLAVLADATAAALLPTLLADATLSPPVATATADAVVPTVGVPTPVVPGHGTATVGTTAGTVISGATGGNAHAGTPGGTATPDSSGGSVKVLETGGEATIG